MTVTYKKILKSSDLKPNTVKKNKKTDTAKL
jgi:hypothetical protein